MIMRVIMITSFAQLEEYLIRQQPSARIVLCGSADAASLKALALANQKGLVGVSYLVGDAQKTEELCAEHGIKLFFRKFGLYLHLFCVYALIAFWKSRLCLFCKYL